MSILSLSEKTTSLSTVQLRHNKIGDCPFQGGSSSRSEVLRRPRHSVLSLLSFGGRPAGWPRRASIACLHETTIEAVQVSFKASHDQPFLKSQSLKLFPYWDPLAVKAETHILVPIPRHCSTCRRHSRPVQIRRISALSARCPRNPLFRASH